MDWKLIACDHEFWNVINYVYVSWNLPTSPVLSLSRFSSNVNTISAAETGISIASTPRSCRNFCHVLGLKIALILLLRHFWTLNVSSLKQRKGNNIYKLTQTWNSECSSYKYSMWQRTNVRTLRVCLQQRSSKVTWNYTWNLTLRRWICFSAFTCDCCFASISNVPSSKPSKNKAEHFLLIPVTFLAVWCIFMS